MADNIIQFPVPEVDEPYSSEYEAVLNEVDKLSWEEREDLFCYLWFNGHAPVGY